MQATMFLLIVRCTCSQSGSSSDNEALGLWCMLPADAMSAEQQIVPAEQQIVQHRAFDGKRHMP